MLYFFSVGTKELSLTLLFFEFYVPSKSTVPEPSVSISAMIPSKSSDVNLSSNAANISLKVAVVI